MRRKLGLDWRVVGAFVLILILACGAVISSRAVHGPASVASEASQTEKDCEAAKKANGGKETKECKNLATLTLEDPIALYTFILTVATVLLFVATCGLWYMAVRQSQDTREGVRAAAASAEAAIRSGEIAQSAMIAANRAWIKVELPDVQGCGLTIFNNILTGMVSLDIRNAGNAPALSVVVNVWLFVDNGTRNEDEWFMFGLEKIRQRQPPRGYVLFPGEMRPNPSMKGICYSCSVNASEIDGALDYGKSLGQRGFPIKICGCVAYKVPYDDRIHLTPFRLAFNGGDGGYIRIEEIMNIDARGLGRDVQPHPNLSIGWHETSLPDFAD